MMKISNFRGCWSDISAETITLVVYCAAPAHEVQHYGAVSEVLPALFRHADFSLPLVPTGEMSSNTASHSTTGHSMRTLQQSGVVQTCSDPWIHKMMLRVNQLRVSLGRTRLACRNPTNILATAHSRYLCMYEISEAICFSKIELSVFPDTVIVWTCFFIVEITHFKVDLIDVLAKTTKRCARVTLWVTQWFCFSQRIGQVTRKNKHCIFKCSWSQDQSISTESYLILRTTSLCVTSVYNLYSWKFWITCWILLS